MYKNQLQELAQRSCFNLPSYVCIREGPDHAPRFKAKVNFNGETFESPTFCSTLRQAEHAAAEVALHVLSKKSPSKALAARVLDETGVYKNLLQETAHRAGLKLPVYTTIRSGPSHVPVFSCTVELAGMSFTGEAAKTKKQAQKNAAITAWAALKKMSKPGASSSSSATSLESGGNDEQEQVTVARYLAATQPAETNKSVRDGRLRQGSASVRSDLISHGRGGSLYSLRCKDWAYSQFWPKGSMHQIWPQERGCHQWNQPLVLSSVPSSPTEPQVFPFIQPIDQADQRHYFVGQEQEPISPLLQIRPFLHFSNHSVSASVRSVSQITIQEVEEESQAKQEWLIDDGDCDCWKPPNAAGFSPTAVASSFCSLRRHSEQMLQEKDEEIGQSLPHIGNSTQLESNQTELYHQISQGITDARFRPRTINAAEANFLSQSSYTSEDMNFQLRNSHSFDHLHSDVRQKNIPVVSSARSGRASVPDFLVAPVTVTKIGALSGGIRSGISIPLTRAPLPMRAAASACLPKPWLAGVKDNQGIPSAKFMAPAVHIRSVIPVCSAPCAKKFPTPSQGHVSQVERKNTKEPGGNIAAASSDLGNLRI